MTKKLVFIFNILLQVFLVNTYASEKVAKAIITRGKVVATLPDGKSINVKKGTWLVEGAKVTTAKKSFVKFLFTDKSQMNLGPNSEMEIAKFDGNQEAGIINLMKGSLRSKVTKNYLKEKQAKSKLFVKTKTAAMGVRGTDFMVQFNPITKITNLDVISGRVAMAPINDLKIMHMNDRGALEKMVSSNKAVMVQKGQYTTTKPGLQKAPPPKMIPKTKLKDLKKNIIPKAAAFKNDPLRVFKVGNKVVKPLSKMVSNAGGEYGVGARTPASADIGSAQEADPRLLEKPILLGDPTKTGDPEFIDPIMPPPPPPEDPCMLDPEACSGPTAPVEQRIDPCQLDPAFCGGGTRTKVKLNLNQSD